MRLAASILCFFSSMLLLCRSIWFAWVVRRHHGTLTFPRVRTSDPSAGIAYSKTIFFPDRYRWWPFAMGPPIGTRGIEMRPPVTGHALTSCRGSDLDCRVGGFRCLHCESVFAELEDAAFPVSQGAQSPQPNNLTSFPSLSCIS